MKLDVATLSVPKEGETANGDALLVRTFDTADVFAVVDGLGHGPAAAEASRAGTQVVERLERVRPALEVIESMHAAMRGTRGAAALVCVVHDDGQVEGCGVGNVELRCRGGHVPATLSPGILGRQVRRFMRFEGSVTPGTRLFAFTDGISSRVPLDEVSALSPAEACKSIFDEHRRTHDDATILIADVIADVKA